MFTGRRLVVSIAVAAVLAMFAAGSPAALASSVSRVGSFALDAVSPSSSADRKPIDVGTFGGNASASNADADAAFEEHHYDEHDHGVASAAAAAAPSGQDSPFAHGADAVARLGTQLPEVASRHGMASKVLEELFLSDPSIGVDADGELAYFDMAAPGEADTTASADGAVAAPPTTGAEFQLESNPGASKTIYLDFDGHVTEGTTWNSSYGITQIVSPAYDRDGSPNTWNSTELKIIRDSFAVVAEDFAPWDVNVTTKDPGVEALRRSSSSDTEWGARVVITRDTWAGCGCGGHAYFGSFDDHTDEPSFVYNSGFRGLSETISHEVGHMLLLTHDGTTSGTTYYRGHKGEGEPGWAPIMGSSFYQPVTHWSLQEYTGANNKGSSANRGEGPDDVAVIGDLANGNNFGLRPDDHGDDASSATLLVGEAPSAAGVIGTRHDVDVFAFTTAGGTVDLAADPATVGANLDIQMTVRDSSGEQVAVSNPIGGLNAVLSVDLPAGTYSVEIDGVGVGDPTASSPTGYSDYASIGQYTLSGVMTVAEPDTDAPAVPSGLSASEENGVVTVSWNANGESDLAGYIVSRSSAVGGGYQELASTVDTSYVDPNPLDGTSYYVVAATDVSGNVSANSAAVVVVISTPNPHAYASQQSTVAGTVTGPIEATRTKDGTSQTITETESGGRKSQRHDLADHRWTFAVATGVQTLHVAATAVDGGDNDEGFALEWSRDGSTWLPVARVSQTSPIDASIELGWATDSIQIRVIDTNRSSGQRLADSISVDMLALASDGSAVNPVPASLALASLSTSTQSIGKGNRQAVATVTVIDDLGVPVVGAEVTVQFSGDITGSASLVTNGSGVAVIESAPTSGRPSVDACVASITGTALTYMAGTEGC